MFPKILNDCPSAYDLVHSQDMTGPRGEMKRLKTLKYPCKIGDIHVRLYPKGTEVEILELNDPIVIEMFRRSLLYPKPKKFDENYQIIVRFPDKNYPTILHKDQIERK